MSIGGARAGELALRLENGADAGLRCRTLAEPPHVGRVRRGEPFEDGRDGPERRERAAKAPLSDQKIPHLELADRQIVLDVRAIGIDRGEVFDHCQRTSARAEGSFESALFLHHVGDLLVTAGEQALNVAVSRVGGD